MTYELNKGHVELSKSINLIVQSDESSFNIKDGTTSPFQTVTFGQLNELPANMYLASQYFCRIIIKVLTAPSLTIQQQLIDVMSRSQLIVLEVDDDILVKDIELLLSLFVNKSLLYYKVMKCKKVGEN